MATPRLPAAVIKAAAEALYNMCSETSIPWEHEMPQRQQAYRSMAKRTLLAGLEAQRHLRAVAS